MKQYIGCDALRHAMIPCAKDLHHSGIVNQRVRLRAINTKLRGVLQNVQSVRPKERRRVAAVNSASILPMLPASSTSISVRSFGGFFLWVIARISPESHILSNGA